MVWFFRLSLLERYCPMIRGGHGGIFEGFHGIDLRGNIQFSEKCDKFDDPETLFKSDEIKKTYILESSHKGLHDFVPVNARMCVSQEFKDIVEHLEPDTHQFFPVEKIVRKNGSPALRVDGRVAVNQYYIFKCMRLVEPVMPVLPPNRYYSIYSPIKRELDPPGGNDIYFRKCDVKNNHLWRSKSIYVDGAYFFASDVVADRIRAMKLKGYEKLYVHEL